MKRIVLIILCLPFFITTTKSQNLSYSCPRDTILGCNSTCFTLKAIFPDIRDVGSNYTLQNISSQSACRPYVAPGGAGTSANLDDDDYFSAVINIGFNFPFFGVNKPSLVVSTNGVVCFDLSEALQGTEFGILNNSGTLSASVGTPQNLPSNLYQKSIIMGPYHDIMPGANLTGSPNQKIKYNVIGTAPNRKWILSFYKIPLFDCTDLIENTHQIVLHESTGIIEVQIFDKEICTSWNQGRAMIGIQDDTRTKSIMAPGRKASDAPWGSVGMNEVWRFIPTGGAPLYRSVELLDNTGAVVATGDTTRLNDNTFETTFANVCPPSGNSFYVVKTTYQVLNNPGASIYSLDTINVIRQAALPVSLVNMTPTTCGTSSGSVTLAAAGTPPYTYSEPPGAGQPGPTFTGLAAGPHTFHIVDATGCQNDIVVNVTSISSIPSTVVPTNPSCAGVNNGSIVVTPTAGTPGFTYSIDGGVTTQPSGTFPNLGPGTYTITYTDANLCTGSTAAITLTAGASLVASETHSNTTCSGATDGSITITPQVAGSYTFTITPAPVTGPATNTTGIFTNLASGTYSVTFASTVNGCTGTKGNIVIAVGGSIPATWTHNDETCPGLNDGVITVIPSPLNPGSYTFTITPAPGTGPATNTTGVFSGMTPGTFYNVTFTNTTTGCGGSMTTLFVLAGTGLTATPGHTDVSCPGANDGTVTLTPTTPGTYTYTITPAPVSGPATNNTGVFLNLAANTYTATISTGSGCSATYNNIVVIQGAGLSGTSLPTATSCLGATNGGVTITPAVPGTYSYTITPAPVSGPATNTTGVFTNLAANTYSVTFSNPTGCSGTINNIIVPPGAGLTGSSAPSATSCLGASDGSVTITPSVAGTYSYTITPAPVSGPATNTTGIFNNLAANTYSVTFSNAAGCSGTVNTIVINPGAGLTGTSAPTGATCLGANNGAVTITPTVAGTYSFTITPAPASGPATNTTGIFANLSGGTYSVTFTNAAGCSGVINNINVSPGTSLAGSSVPTATSCLGANDGTIAVTPTIAGTHSFTITPAPVTGPATNSTGVFNNLADGTYSVTFTNASGCSGILNNIVVAPGAGLTGSSLPAGTSCLGATDGTITITPTVAGTYSFTITPAPVAGPATNSTGIFNNLAADTYSVTFTNGAGCSGVINSIVVAPGANLVASALPAPTSCQGAVNGSVTVTPAVAGTYTYTITPAPASGPATNNTGVFNNLADGVYSVTLNNTIGCSGTINNINVSPGAVLAGTSAPVNTTCPGVDDGMVTITPSVADAYSFTITPAPVSGPATNSTGIFSNLAANTYSVTFSNAAGCTATVNNIVINTGTTPAGAATPFATSCPTVNDGSLTVSIPSGNGGPYTFTISGPSGTFTQSGPTSTTFTGLIAGIYTVNYVSNTGCTGSVTPSPEIIVGPYLNSTFTTFNPPCAFINDGTITIVPEATSAAPYAVTLTGPGGPYNINSATPVFSNLEPGTYNYSFTDANGCTGIGGPIVLTTHAPLALSLVKTIPLCNAGTDGTITLTASGGLASYEYALSPFTVFQPTGTFNNLAAGTYTFRIKDNAGCTKDTTVTLDEPTLLTASAVSTAGTCNGNDGTITVTGYNGTPNYTYSIDGINYQAAPDFTVSGGPASGALYPNISVKDANGCIASASAVSVALIDNMGSLYIGNDTTICAEQHVAFQPQVSNMATVFTWTTYPDASQVSSLDDDSIKNATATPVDTTNYILTAQWGVCSRIDTITINLLHKPIPYAGKDTAVCFDKTTAVLHGSASNLSGTVNFEWSDTTNLATPHVATTVATPTNTETYTLTVTDNYGCNFSVTDQVVVVVQPPVPAFAGNDTIAVIGQPHQLLATGGVSYEWSPSASLNLSNVQTPLATLDHDQMFHVTVTDVAGCVGSDDVFVQVYPGPAYHVPTAFSPNGDGLNDVFRVIPAGIAYTDWFRIFNRYGQLVFATNQWLKGWDGTYQGKKQPIGNYVWVLKGKDKNGKVVEMKGTVLLVQ